MEFSSIWFFSFSSLLSLVFLTTGLYSLDKAPIFAHHEWIKHGIQACISSSVIYSMSYAFLFRPLREHRGSPDVRKLIAFYDPFHPELIKSLIISIFLLYCFFLFNQDKVYLIFLLLVSLPLNVYFFHLTLKYFMPYENRDRNGNLFARIVGPLLLYPHHSLCWACLILFLFFSLRSNFEDKYKHMFLGSVVGLGLDFGLSFSIWCFTLLPMKISRSDSSILIYAYKHRKMLEIIVGIISVVLAQYIFSEKSVPLMFAFFYFAITWLGNLANVRPSSDLGIFHFFVISSLECAASLFKLRFYTFLVLCGCIVLEILRWKIESVSLKHTGIRWYIWSLIGFGRSGILGRSRKSEDVNRGIREYEESRISGRIRPYILSRGIREYQGLGIRRCILPRRSILSLIGSGRSGIREDQEYLELDLRDIWNNKVDLEDQK